MLLASVSWQWIRTLIFYEYFYYFFFTQCCVCACVCACTLQQLCIDDALCRSSKWHNRHEELLSIGIAAKIDRVEMMVVIVRAQMQAELSARDCIDAAVQATGCAVNMYPSPSPCFHLPLPKAHKYMDTQMHGCMFAWMQAIEEMRRDLLVDRQLQAGDRWDGAG